MKPILQYLLIGLTTLTLISCGEEKKKEEPPPPSVSLNCDSAALPSPARFGNTTVRDLNLTLNLVNFTNGSRGYISLQPANFTLPANTISFAIQIFGQGTLFRDLTNPAGATVFQGLGLSGATNTRFRNDFGCASNILVPKKPGVPATAGQWTYTVQSDIPNPQVKLVVRTGNLPARATITVKPYLTGTTYSPADLQPALDRFSDIFGNYNIDLVLQPVQRIGGAQYTEVSEDFNNSRTAELISRGEADKVNVFFVHALTPRGGGRVGIAAGIPGSLGVKGQYNGVLVGLTEHVGGGGLVTNAVGETAAHEMGHFLGLFHTTEQTGTTFDILNDTPECRRPQPLTPANCRDGENLMFWTGDQNIVQTRLSIDQLDVIKRSPLAR